MTLLTALISANTAKSSFIRSANEKELSHRWRERASLRTLVLKSYEN